MVRRPAIKLLKKEEKKFEKLSCSGINLMACDDLENRKSSSLGSARAIVVATRQKNIQGRNQSVVGAAKGLWDSLVEKIDKKK